MSLLYRILAWAAVALTFTLFAGFKGYTLGDAHATAKYLAAEARAEQAATQRYVTQVKRGDDLAAQLSLQQQFARHSIQALRQEVPRVTIHTVSLPGGKLETLAPLALTRGTVCVYNRAWTGGSVPNRTAPGGADATAATACADATRLSDYTESDWLDTDLTNAGICRANSVQLGALVQYVRALTDGHR